MNNKPSMIRLTQIGGVPEVNGGAPTEAYVDPNLISLIVVAYSALTIPVIDNESGKETGRKPGPFVECSAVYLTTGGSLSVIEKPRAIMILREIALGNRKPLEGVEGE